MQEFSAALVREKIEFIDDGEGHSALKAGTVRSNRIYLRLETDAGIEKVVIRTQTMPTALRLASRVMFSFYRNGAFLGRAENYDWDVQWDGVLSAYDRNFTPDLWAAVYINGRSVFKTVSSPFVDIVEQCALLSIDNYDAAINVTENALRKTGHAMRVNHSSNVAAVFTDTEKQMRCGIIHRMDGRDKTFSFTADGGDRAHRVVQALGVAGGFLEAVNLRRVIKNMQDKIRLREAAKASPEATRMRAATARLVVVDKSITSFEELYDVKYRPQKPDFFGND